VLERSLTWTIVERIKSKTQKVESKNFNSVVLKS
jgi:hypothetical protein